MDEDLSLFDTLFRVCVAAIASFLVYAMLIMMFAPAGKEMQSMLALELLNLVSISLALLTFCLFLAFLLRRESDPIDLLGNVVDWGD